MNKHLLLVSHLLFLFFCRTPIEITDLHRFAINCLKLPLANWPNSTNSTDSLPIPTPPVNAHKAPWFYLGFSSTRIVASSDGQSRDVSKYVNLAGRKNGGARCCWIQGGAQGVTLPKTDILGCPWYLVTWL